MAGGGIDEGLMPSPASWVYLVSLAWWLGLAAAFLKARAALPRLAALPLQEQARWPRVSVVVPARDEGRHVGEALRAKLADGYPALEVVLVDDRSTDDTGAQARAIAAVDGRVTVARVDALPEGWLGKVHALQVGLEHASGEWILFSDADVHLAPGTLQRLVAWADREGVDHLVCLPGLTGGGPGITATLAGFFRMVFTLSRLWAVERPDSSAAVGAGAFNLFRRAALDRTPGLPWLRMEIGDDMALGVMLKRGGARQRAVVAREAVSLEFYPSLAAMTRALEKNGASAPMPLVVLGCLLLVVLELGWLAGPSLPAVGLAGAVAALTQLGVCAWLGLPRWPALLPGLGVLPLAWAMIRSSALALVRGGVRWRGTFYPTAVVRAGMRLGVGRPPANSDAPHHPGR